MLMFYLLCFIFIKTGKKSVENVPANIKYPDLYDYSGQCVIPAITDKPGLLQRPISVISTGSGRKHIKVAPSPRAIDLDFT